MVTVQQWTAQKAAALRRALRQNKSQFAKKAGVTPRTVTNWETGAHAVASFSCSILDTVLADSDQDTQRRFALTDAIATVYDVSGLCDVTARWFPSMFDDVFLAKGTEMATCGALVDRAERLGRLAELATRLRHDSGNAIFDFPLQQILSLDSRSPAVQLAPPLEPGMVHRSDDLDAVVALLTEAAAADPAGAVAVWGPGGFGKTTLATQVGHDPRITSLFPTILWVETGEQCTPARVVQLIADLCVHLGGERPALSDAEQAGFHLAQLLGDRQVLLVIDNVWSATDLGPFLLGGAHCVRLVTTRNLRVCPSHAAAAPLGPMSGSQVRELLTRTVAGLPASDAAYLADLCAGWPLLASIVGSNVSQDVAAGAPHHRAVVETGSALQSVGPHALDVADPAQRRAAIGHAIDASLASLQDTVSIGGGTDLRARYLSLAIFPAATAIPLTVLSTWWATAYGWTHIAVRQFCRLLADRSLVAAYRADQDVIVLHDVFRAYLRHLLAPDLPELHRSLIDAHRPADADWARMPDEQRYLWRHLPYHLREAELDDELVVLLARPDYVVAKAVRCGPDALLTDHALLTPAPAGRGNDARDRAAALTGAAYLLSGLTSSGDIAATLLIILLRTGGNPDAAQELRGLSHEGHGFTVDWISRAVGTSTGEDGHVGAVTSVAVHETMVVSGGEDGTVKLGDLTHRRLRQSLVGHTGWVFAVAVTADGRIIASAGDDGIIRLWDADTGAARAALLGHTRRIRSLAFTQHGRLLVSGGDDGQVCLWDTERPGLLTTMKTPGSPVWSVAVGCADTLVAVAGADEYLRLYDLRTGELVDERAAHRDWIRAVAFARTTATLAAGSGDGTATTWTVTSQHLIPGHRLPRQPTRIRTVALSDGGDVLITAGEDATLRAYTTGQPTGAQPSLAHVDWIRAITRDQRGTVIAGCEDGSIRTWHHTDQTEPAVVSPGRNTIWSAAVAHDGHLAVLGAGDGTIQLRDSASTHVVRTLSAGAGRVWSLSSGGSFVGAACGDGSVRLWSLEDKDFFLRLDTQHDRTWAVAINAAGTRLATSTRGAIQLWDLPTGNLLWSRPAHGGERIRTLALDHAGELLISGGGDGTAQVWQTATGTTVAAYPNPGGWVRAVTIDHTGERVAIGYGPGDIQVHHLTGEHRAAELTGHRGRPLLLAFTTDTDHLISAAADGTVRAWSVPEQRHHAQVRVAASLHCAAYDPATASVVAASATAVTRITAPRPPQKG